MTRLMNATALALVLGWGATVALAQTNNDARTNDARGGEAMAQAVSGGGEQQPQGSAKRQAPGAQAQQSAGSQQTASSQTWDKDVIGDKQIALPFDQLRVGQATVILMSEKSAAELKQMPVYEESRYNKVEQDPMVGHGHKGHAAGGSEAKQQTKR